MMYYDKLSYARERLTNTVVQLRDKTPVYLGRVLAENSPEYNIDGLDEDGEIFPEPPSQTIEGALCQYIELASYEGYGEGIKTCPLSEVDLTPVSLGYVNTISNLSYITRKPTRSWKQGLGSEQMFFIHSHKEGDIVDVNKWWYRGLHNTILRNYPSIDEALYEVNNKGIERAFAPDFAINNKLNLLYKASVVGDIESEGNIIIYDEFFFLSQYLDECIGGDYAY